MRFHVLKPFVFSFPGGERHLIPGDYEVPNDDPFATSAWVKNGADGRVQTEDQNKARLLDLIGMHSNSSEANRRMADEYRVQLHAIDPLTPLPEPVPTKEAIEQLRREADESHEKCAAAQTSYMQLCAERDKLNGDLEALRNEVTLHKATAEGIGSQLLDVQQECVRLRQELESLNSDHAAQPAHEEHPSDPPEEVHVS